MRGQPKVEIILGPPNRTLQLVLDKRSALSKPELDPLLFYSHAYHLF